MHRRLSPLTALAATAVAALAGWIAPATAHAGKYDLDLTRLGSQQGGTLVQDDSGFRSLSSELGTLMAPRPVDSADSLGLAGFAISADVGINTIAGSRDYWSRTTRGGADDVAPTLQVMGRKGLWPGIEVGGGATHLFDSRMWAISGYGKISLHEGFYRLPIPSIALRVAGSRVLGAKDLNMSTIAPSVSASYVFGIGKTFSLTPYLGYEALIIVSRSTVLDASPNCDELPDGYNQDCPGVDPTADNEFVFQDAGAILRHRPYFGLRMLFAVMRLTVEAMYAPAGKRGGELDGTTIADRSKLQQQYTISVGLDF
ncbi:MAG: hypothetical protein IAG13_38385 [Deltaproteobacteria bacterium]|nr:hypothetical protein [Nannocystaceae bacterium]